ncbi:MAG: dipeptide epimerase [Campylobacterales bacterium]|nr:dipeptide epimerase [Campylobacterales bacterium]
MSITNIQTSVEYIALAKPFITALRRVESVEFVRVVIESSQGNGIGEAPATKAITGEDLETILGSIESIKMSLIGRSVKEAVEILHNSSIGSSAKAALDIALFSLGLQERGVDAFEYFGITDFSPIKSDVTISLNPIEQMCTDAQEAIEKGMDILKVKLGEDIAHAIETTRTFLESFENLTLLIDANQAWSREDAKRYVQAFDDRRIALVEQPVIAQDLVGLKDIKEHSTIPILADESAFSLNDVKQIVQTQSADMINIKLMKCGGITKAIEILEYAREQGIVCMLGSMLEGPYSINTAIYLAFAYRDVIHFVDLDSPLLYKEKARELEFNFEGATISYSS